MPIQTQCCGLLIVCIIIYLTYREHNLMLPSKKLYLILSFATFFCIGLDILSVIGIVVPFPPFWMYLVCKAYLTSLVLICYLGFLYADEELHLYFSSKKHTWQKMLIILVVLGHSEGGLIAFMLATKKQTDFIVSLAGPGVKGDTLLAAQGNRILSLSGIFEICLTDLLNRFKGI